MKNRTLALFLLLAAEQLAFLVFFPPVIEPDSFSYMAAAAQARDSGGFSSEVRLPGYPAFLSVFYLVCGQHQLPVIIFQHLLGLLLWFVFMRMLETDRQKAVFSAFYFCDLLYSSYQHAILSDFLFSFLLCMSAWPAWLYARERRARWLFLCGLLVALGMLTKPALKLFPFFLLPVFLAAKLPLRRRLAGAAVFLAAPLLAVNLWSLKNYLDKGYYSLLPQESRHYIGRVVNHIEFPANSVTREYFLAQLPEGKVSRDRKAPAVLAALDAMDKAGLKAEVVDAECRQIFRLSILRRPFSYLKESGVELFYFFFSAHNLYAKYALNDRLPVSAEAGLRSGDLPGLALKILVSLHPFYWLLFALLAWFTAVNARGLAADRNFFMLYAYGLIAYIALVSSMTNEGLARYRCAIQPLMLYISALALARIFPGVSGKSAGGVV